MIDYKSFLSDREIEFKNLSKEKIMILCPFHEDTNRSLGVHLVTGGYNCFGCGRHGSFAELLSKLDDIDIESAKLLLSDSVNIELMLNEINKTLNGDYVQTKKRNITKESFTKLFPELTKESVSYLLKDRKLSREIIVAFGCRQGAGKWNGRIIFPITDYEGNYIGFTGRCNGYLKFKTHAAYDTALNDTFFGLYQARDLMQKYRFCFLVEGVVDTLYLQSFGIPAVGRMSVNMLTDNQVTILIKCADTVYVFYDDDSATKKKNPGWTAAEKTKKALSDYLKCVTIKYEKKEPSDLTKAELYALMDKLNLKVGWRR